MLLDKRAWHVATAESCTGGLLAATFIRFPEVSSYFDRGFVVYNNTAKNQMLGVAEDLLEKYGPVSKPVATAMAKGALQNSRANVAISTTGCAGPNRDERNTPVGIVWVGLCVQQKIFTRSFYFEGNRNSINQQTVYHTLHYLLESLE